MSRDGCGLSGHAVSFPRNCRHFEEESHVGELLQAKGDPTKARYGVTPIYKATEEGHLDCLRFLLEAGAGAPTGGRETTARPPPGLMAACLCLWGSGSEPRPWRRDDDRARGERSPFKLFRVFS